MQKQSRSAARTLRAPVVGIGASAGGIEALQSFFSAIPDDLGAAYVVILHLPPDRDSELATILGRATKMPVEQIGDHIKAKLSPDHVYVIAPNRKLLVTDASVAAARFTEPRGQRAAVDALLRSLAASHSEGFAVVLSGSGSDGVTGARAIKESGGVVLVQDPREAGHDGMPRAVISEGLADVVLPVRELAARLVELVHSRDRVAALLRVEGPAPAIDEDSELALGKIVEKLRKQTGHDFSNYKRGTLLRRVARRMQLAHRGRLSEYFDLLNENVEEMQALFNDLLINVTAFFRDPLAWQALQEQVIGPLVERADADEPIRAWVPGCATGEEAYSLAILFQEEIERRKVERSFTIFASDVDERALATAREGVYPGAISADISEARLERHFRVQDEHYRIASEIRDNVVFAAHSLLRDPPFSRLQLISCRNLLIYLNHSLQEQVMGMFQYACRHGAYLFLGVSETADDQIFHPIDKKHRIFQVRKSAEDDDSLPELLATPQGPVRHAHELKRSPRQLAAELHIQALEAVAPPSLIVDERWCILHLSNSVARYLQQRGGPFASKILDAVRPELREEVHRVLHRAFGEAEQELSRFVPVRFNGTALQVAVLAQRHRQSKSARAHVLLTFLEAGEMSDPDTSKAEEASSGLVQALREKLRQAELRADSMRNEYQLTNEDLRAANEELQSLNEEFRSTTEELETSKEELQSINDELETVNQELKVKIDEISRANDDLENLMAATNIATLFLDRDLQINRFTPRLADLFNVTPDDEGRPIGNFTHSLNGDYLQEDARAVLDGQGFIEREVTSKDGRVFIVRIAPYRTSSDETGGVVATFVDVSQLKRAEQALHESNRLKDEFLATLGHELRNPLAAIRSSMAVHSSANSSEGESEHAWSVVDRQSRHMIRLVNDLLDIVRIERGKLRLQRESVALADCVGDAIDAVESCAQAANLTMTVDLPEEPIYVDADPERLVQILGNLLHNAVNYSHEGGRITVAARARADQAVITVHDTGMGMDSAEIETLFEPYRQANERDDHGGLGLGLTVVKRLVQLHGGTVSARSEGAETGSELEFTLPLARRAAAVPSASQREMPARHRVLVVDDDRDVADMFAALLDSLGQEVEVVYHGSAVLAAVRRRPADIIFIDLSMPEINGNEVARRLRQEPASARSFLVALSGYGIESRQSAADFDQHLLKPAGTDELISLLNAVPARLPPGSRD